jgi:hypothetical protein
LNGITAFVSNRAVLVSTKKSHKTRSSIQKVIISAVICERFCGIKSDQESRIKDQLCLRSSLSNGDCSAVAIHSPGDSVREGRLADGKRKGLIRTTTIPKLIFLNPAQCM